MQGILKTHLGLTLEELKSYHKLYDKVMKALVDLNVKVEGGHGVVTKWMEKNAVSNVLPESRTDCLLVASVYKSLMITPLSADMMEKAFLLDWSIEFFHGGNTMANNIMDGKTRLNVTGNPAWHTLNNVGLMAVNDTFVLKGLGYNTIRIFFGEDDAQYNLLEDLRNDMCQKFILGRGLYEKIKTGSWSSQTLTLECYRQMVDFECGYCSFYIPALFAFALAGKAVNSQVDNDLKDILLDIGYYHRIQRDYTDIFFRDGGDTVTKGEIKCNWFFVKSVQVLAADNAALSRLEDCVEARSLSQVQKIYKANGLLKSFIQEKNILAAGISVKIANLQKASDDKGVANLSRLLRSTVE